MNCKIPWIMASLKGLGVSYSMFILMLTRLVADASVCLETGPFLTQYYIKYYAAHCLKSTGKNTVDHYSKCLVFWLLPLLYLPSTHQEINLNTITRLVTAACDLWAVIFSNFNKHPDICSLPFRCCCCAYWLSSWLWCFLWERAVMGTVGTDDHFPELIS